MSKQIEEVMALVDELATNCIAAGIAKMAGSGSAKEEIRSDVRTSYAAIETKLRELLRNHEANKEALDEYFKKTDWVNGTFQSHELGHHRADVLRMRIEKLQKQVQK